MYIAEQLKKRNISEYLLYMWQGEDTLRAYGLDSERMANEYIPFFQLDEEKSELLKGWYESLIQMMRGESRGERTSANQQEHLDFADRLARTAAEVE